MLCEATETWAEVPAMRGLVTSLSRPVVRDVPTLEVVVRVFGAYLFVNRVPTHRFSIRLGNRRARGGAVLTVYARIEPSRVGCVIRDAGIS